MFPARFSDKLIASCQQDLYKTDKINLSFYLFEYIVFMKDTVVVIIGERLNLCYDIVSQ